MQSPNKIAIKMKFIKNTFDQTITKAIQPLGLTASQAFFIQFIVHSPAQPVYQKDIESIFGLKHPTVVGIISRLESKGFVECSVDQRDRRYKCVTPTEKAVSVADSINKELEHTETTLMSGFTDEEKQLLDSLLDKMIENTPEDIRPQACLPAEVEKR